MKKYVLIEGVPALIRGNESDKIMLAVYGLIDSFADSFKAVVDKVNSEHYFHSDEQLEVLQNWIKRWTE